MVTVTLISSTSSDITCKLISWHWADTVVWISSSISVENGEAAVAVAPAVPAAGVTKETESGEASPAPCCSLLWAVGDNNVFLPGTVAVASVLVLPRLLGCLDAATSTPSWYTRFSTTQESVIKSAALRPKLAKELTEYMPGIKMVPFVIVSWQLSSRTISAPGAPER
ncbi:hypothetical protein DQ04_01481140 [Trypanosoma grayi]|uniref:hypothetical protein n=1 Tax=Trypanosoma grayi TaxID=71804 RepID=UPI0004F4B315|nr:hypothetical protein DQ04_01481140 [Trypanosoma grayi]KEG12711.1 hypothetical protein DQ04_01481140 [Trypanosoma grayi]